MIISHQDKKYQQEQFMNVEAQTFRITHFKYLGHLLTQYNDLKLKSILEYTRVRALLNLEKY